MFELHNGNAFGHVIRAVALNLSSGTVGESNGVNRLNRFGVGVELRSYVSEAVYSRNDISRVLAQAVEDNAQGLNPYFVGVFGNLYCAFRRGKAFVSRKEAEAVGFFGKEHSTEISVS